MLSLVGPILLAAVVCPRSRAQYRVFWGDVHGHTIHSDGKGSLDDYFTFARDVAKLDFVIVTDHDFGNAAPWRMPQATWKLTQCKADAYTSEKRFVAIAGYEWTSQPKYWTGVADDTTSERLFSGAPKFYNHKNVYFGENVDYLFSAKDPNFMSPDLLAAAVLLHGGLIQNNHPTAGPEGSNQWDYNPAYYAVITNTEIDADVLRYAGKTYEIGVERTVRGFLDRGGKTGFVKGTDTHDGKPAARTAVLAKQLTRDAVFDALRNRRNYAVSNARIWLSFKIDGHEMGEVMETAGNPTIDVDIRGTDKIEEVVVIRNGAALHSLNPRTERVKFTYVDRSFHSDSYYYLRVTQVDNDEHGNPSRAWSSPIWATRTASAPRP